MKLKNGFSEETRLLFFYNTRCFWCDRTHGVDALHHILGRVSDSPFNACPINNGECHIGNSLLDSFENRAMLLRKTFDFLMENRYQPTPEDKEFVKNNKQYYLWKKSSSE